MEKFLYLIIGRRWNGTLYEKNGNIIGYIVNGEPVEQ